MTTSDFASIAAYLLGSIGGGAALVIALSSWLGKVWAQRIMDSDRAKYERELTELKTKLEHDAQGNLRALETDLSIFKEHHLRGLNDKLLTYRLAVDMISEILADLDLSFGHGQIVNPGKFDQYNRQRMKVYGYLAMVASQNIMDAQDKLVDRIILIANGEKSYVWSEIRELALALLNEIRKDLKFDETPIAYNGLL